MEINCSSKGTATQIWTIFLHFGLTFLTPLICSRCLSAPLCLQSGFMLLSQNHLSECIQWSVQLASLPSVQPEQSSGESTCEPHHRSPQRAPKGDPRCQPACFSQPTLRALFPQKLPLGFTNPLLSSTASSLLERLLMICWHNYFSFFLALKWTS